MKLFLFCRPNLRIGMAVVLISLLVFPPLSTRAHFDPPSPPPIRVRATLLDAKIFETGTQYEGADPSFSGSIGVSGGDGADQNYELTLSVAVNHETHGAGSKTFSIDDWTPSKFESGYSCGAGTGKSCGASTYHRHVEHHGFWDITEGLWDHEECTPRNLLSVAAVMIERDTELTEAVLITLGDVSLGVALAIIAAAPPVAIAGALAAAAVSIAAAINGHDDMGIASGIIPENGTVTIESRGEDGGADIRIVGNTTPISDTGQCRPPTPPPPPSVPPPQTPEERADSIFGVTEEVIEVVPLVEAEPGNPAGLTEEQLEEIRKTLYRFALGIAETVAGLQIDAAARSGLRIDAAIADFDAAVDLASRGDLTAANTAYKAAFLKAAGLGEGAESSDSGASFGGDVHQPLLDGFSLGDGSSVVPGEGASDIGDSPDASPLRIALSPDFYSTKPYRTPVVVATVLGATGNTSLRVTGVPDGADAEVVPVGEGTSAFSIRLRLGDVEPGEHRLQVIAADNDGEAQRELTLVVNALPCEQRLWRSILNADLPDGLTKSLLSTLATARGHIERGASGVAARALNAITHRLSAQTGKKIPGVVAASLQETVNACLAELTP